MGIKILALVFSILILVPINCTEENAGPDNRAIMGAVIGFPIGYVVGLSTLSSSGDENPGTSAFAQGLAGAAAGYMAVSSWKESEDAYISTLSPEDKKKYDDYIKAKKELDDAKKALEEAKKKATPSDQGGVTTAQTKVVTTTEEFEKAKGPAQTILEGIKNSKGSSTSQNQIKSGAIAGLVAGAIGTTFSGSSGGSGGGNDQANTANTGATAVPQGPSAMSSKMPIIHSIIAGAVTAVAMGEIKPMLEKMTSKMENMHEKALEKQKEECDKQKGTWVDNKCEHK